VRLLEVQMTTTDLSGAASFYEQALELPVLRQEDVVRVTVGSSRLTLRQGGVGNGSHHVAMTVPAHELDEAKRRLSSRVPLLRRDGADEFSLPAPWRSRSVYFLGPDAVLLELIARGDLSDPTDTDGRGRPVSISEVGVAVEDVGAAAHGLRETFGLDRFDAGGPGFAPVGDHHGLLVVVARRRTWFPTDDLVPSEAPSTVSLDVGSRSAHATLVLGACTLSSGPG
jgi:catechol-2,3-dioxygenase